MKLNIFYPLLIVTIVVIFFFRLFYPEPHLVITPDFGRSDAWHSSFASKVLLHESLSNGILPFWTEKIGGGHPIFAEGLIGALFFPNIVLFWLFDVVTAYNLALVSYIALFGIGMYVWCRALRVAPTPSLFAGATAALSGITILQATHMMVLPALAVLPWIMAANTWFLQKPTIQRGSLIALLVSQQIFAGFPQLTFITMLFACFYTWHFFRHNWSWHTFMGLSIAWGLGIAGSLVQLAPSIEFLQASSFPSGFNPTDSTYFSFPFKHVVTFFQPFALGNPQNGTFEHFTKAGSVFWENTGYIGILPLILLVIAWSIPKIRKTVVIFWITLGTSFLLMLGRHSPVYFLYAFWPLTLFRVPSRFLIMFVVSLIIISTYAYSYLWNSIKWKRGKVILLTVLLVHGWQLFTTWYPYHAVAPARQWLSVPTVAASATSSKRIYTIGSEVTHNQTFITHGWTSLVPYEQLRGSLAPNSNVIWAVPSAQVYAGRTLSRVRLFDDLLTNEITIQHEATVSAFGEKLLNMLSVDTVLSTLPLTHHALESQTDTATTSDATTSVYQNPHAVPRAYFATDIQIATTARQAFQTLASDTFHAGQTILLEEDVGIVPADKAGTATIVHETSEAITIKTNSSAPGILILTDTYYPGWQAAIDGTPARIHAANIRQRAVVVPKGDHSVEFTFRPSYFTLWATISTAAYILIFIGVLSPLRALVFRTLQIALSPLASRGGNHGR